ncbi:unnamed protein product [Rotaria magnacalcarata]|uniref:Chitin-binding type-2 domain-containing protein n=6 Tax=Rotaria magnacalcarata TaxID=392030 RepID=A0A816Z493_9BILA|nr:unnamed protein product [Rotaria magnacalcarata]CAF3759079.1 unnamed protein product [Rotaria magnacalcarata]
MSISRRHLFCIILLYISTDSLHAKQHSVYVQNYHQEFDYANADRIPSPSSSSFQKEDDIRSTSNEDLENFQSTTLPTAEFLSDISANDALSTITPVHDSRIGTDLISTSEKTILPHKSTNSPHNMSLPSTKNEYYDFDYREPTPPHEHVNQTTDTFQINNSTNPTFVQNYTDLLVDWSNKTHIVRKIFPINKQYETNSTILEEPAKHLTDRKSMQSLIHLLPPNFWSQIQHNQSIVPQNQTNYIKPFLPNPVLLAEAAAQAGLPGPGPYPIPEHLWPRNPPQTVLKLSKTTTTSRPLYLTQTTTLRPRPFVPVKPATSPPNNNNMHSLFAQLGFNCPLGVNNIRFPDRRLCNMYYTCLPSGLPEPNLCPEGHLFSESSYDCELTSKVNCGARVAAYFEPDDNQVDPITSTSQSQFAASNGTIECILGADGYFEDPLYCNVYHHCIAGMDYIEHCPNQLAWNEKKKMCDWATNVNCTGKTMPVVQSKTSFCTNRQDGRYPSEKYCNVFHHCIGGTDHIVRCTGELQWDDRRKECGWESSVHCGAPKKMLPHENKFNSTFCTGKTDGSYPNGEYCNVYHVCESGTDSMRQCPHQLFWDNEQKKCEWSDKVHCSGRTLVALSMKSSLFCMEKSNGVYMDPQYCNVYHQCMADIDVKLQCPERLIFNETLKRCDWPELTICKSGNILVENNDSSGFCSDKPNGNFAHEKYCNRYYICQNGKDVVFTCQNNLRYSIEKNECDWAINVDCKGKADYMWEGIKENFCKRLPDGNYPDAKYCNRFHQCQAAMDYSKRCPNRLMFNEESKECDWEDKVDCKGREKFIDTEGLDDSVRPGSNNTRGRSTKFCMLKQNGDYADLFYCNVYHNCHGGFDTIQYCTHGLVWRQESETIGRCDWSKERSIDGVDCSGKAIFFIEKLAEKDILSNLRSEFCISKGPGLYEHQRYCDLYLQCNEQGVGVTMECSPGLVFNEKKKECDYQGDVDDEEKGALCLQPRTFLRSKPKSEQASILFEGVDATGQFPTRFDCMSKNQQLMFADMDWCNIYHVCVGSRDNIFLCPPGTIFNDTKQGCMDRFDGINCNGTRSYFKPTMKRQKRIDAPSAPRKLQSYVAIKPFSQQANNQRIPYERKKSYQSRQFNRYSLKRQQHH